VLELRQTFDDRVETAIPQRGEKIDDVEADTYLGDLQARVGRIGEARARLQKVLERRPGTARATLGLGLIDLRADRLEAALPLLERAATEGPDDGQVQGALGRALVSRLGELEYTSDEYAATLKRARSALVRAVELDPNSARSVALLGFAELASRDFERSVTLLTRAVALAPAREEYRLILARAFLGQGQFSRAIDILGTMLATGSTPAIREQARELLAVVANAKNASNASSPASTRPAPEPPAARSASSSPPPVSEPAPAAPPVAPAEAGAGAAARRATSTPAFRPVGPGETRVLGQFRGIVCGRELTVLAIQSQGRLLQLRQNPARPPEFIAYVPNPPSSVGCGPINPPQRVLATYVAAERPSTAYEGDVVAIELIPDDVTPP
jgi:Flp pilus assembly protein TadD